MRPLQSIDYLSITDIDTVLSILIDQTDFIGTESIISEDLNYNQLKTNIDFMRTGFERIETLLRTKKKKQQTSTNDD
jgi:hypothetical protein